MKENLVSLPLCQSSTWPVGVGGDPVWHVEAGDEPSEERPRARNTNALLQEIPGFMMDRSWQPRKKGKTNKKQALCLTFTEFERSLVEPWEFSSKVTVLVIPSSPQSTCGWYALCSPSWAFWYTTLVTPSLFSVFMSAVECLSLSCSPFSIPPPWPRPAPALLTLSLSRYSGLFTYLETLTLLCLSLPNTLCGSPLPVVWRMKVPSSPVRISSAFSLSLPILSLARPL